ncbi:MAG: ankyrin repeat domain-containing protein [Gemmatimonadota bacterium]
MIKRNSKRSLAFAASVAAVLAAATMVRAATPPAAVVADAAMKGDLATVRKLIAQGERVNVAQGDGMTALHWAADRGDSAMTELLIKAKADVKARTRIGQYTPLLIASRVGSAPVVRALLSAGSDVNALSESGATSLHLAAAAGNSVIINALVDRGADVNAREPMWGQTPLIFAAGYDRVDAIKTLLKRGANANVHTKLVNLTEEGTRDQAAARKRNEVLVSFEPEKHKDTTKTAAPGAMAPGAAAPVDTAAAGRGGRGGRGGGPQPKGPFTPAQIQAAIDSGRAVLATASGRGAFTEQVDTINGGVAGYVGSVGGVGGLTALHHAARDGHAGAAIALLDGGANINDTSDVDRTTPLLVALINGQFDVAKLLIDRGADVNIASNSGNTPLYAAINTQWAPRTRFPQPQEIQNQKTHYLELVTALLAKGANPNARLKSQFWYFSFNNCGNANCGLENIDGTTPFWRAAYALDVDVMRMLVKAGADPTTPSARPTPAAGGGRRLAAPGAPRGGGAGDSTAAPRGGRGTIPPGGGGFAGGGGGGGGGGRGGGGGAAPVAIDAQVDSAAKAVKPGSGVYPIHCAAGVGYGNGFAGNSHRHAPDAWMPAMRYLVEELGADVNQRDLNGYTPLHHAAARGDNEMILYLVSKGADPKAVSLNFRTTADMANGPVQRLRPFPETIALLEKLGSKNSHRCLGC